MMHRGGHHTTRHSDRDGGDAGEGAFYRSHIAVHPLMSSYERSDPEEAADGLEGSRSSVSQVTDLPDTLRSLAASVQQSIRLYAELLENYQNITRALTSGVDMLRETELRLSAEGPDGSGDRGDGGENSANDNSSTTYSRVEYSRAGTAAEQVLARLDELAAPANLSLYQAALKSKVTDRLALLCHGAVKLQNDSLLAQRAWREYSDFVAQYEQDQQRQQHRLRGWKGKLRQSIGVSGRPGEAVSYAEAEETMRSLRRNCDDAQSRQRRAACQYAALVNTRLGPALQCYLHFSLTAVADLSVAWESGQHVDDVGDSSATQSSSAATPQCRETRQPPTATARPSGRSAATTPATTPESGGQPDPTAAPRSRHHHHSNSSSIGFAGRTGQKQPPTAVGEVHDVNSQVFAFVGCMWRVIGRFNDVADLLSTPYPFCDGMRRSLPTRPQSGRASDSSTRSDDLASSLRHPNNPYGDNYELMDDEAAAAHPAAGPAEAASAAGGGRVDADLLASIARVNRKMRVVLGGPRLNWYGVKMAAGVEEPLRALAREMGSSPLLRRGPPAAGPTDVAPLLGDLLRKAVATLWRVQAHLSTTTAAAAGGERARLDSSLLTFRDDHAPSFDARRTRSPPGDPLPQVRQEAAALEAIWAEFVHINVNFYSGITRAISTALEEEDQLGQLG